MKTETSPIDRPDYDRPFIDHDFHRTVAAQMRAEAINNALARGLSVVTPTRRTLRNLSLAFLIATGAFWTVMLNDPPQTVAADPSTSAKAFSPLSLPMPLDLPMAVYVDQ
jgi:hypothetical protein